MFNWWSSLGPQASQSSENVGEKPAEGEQNSSVEGCSGDGETGKTDTQQKERSQDSKTSELDYAKDMAKNVGSKLKTCVWICRFGQYWMWFTGFNTVLPYHAKKKTPHPQNKS